VPSLVSGAAVDASAVAPVEVADAAAADRTPGERSASGASSRRRSLGPPKGVYGYEALRAYYRTPRFARAVNDFMDGLVEASPGRPRPSSLAELSEREEYEFWTKVCGWRMKPPRGGFR
jgi:hypothetical protein